MDDMMKDLVWNEDINKCFFQRMVNGIYDGQLTVAELRKLAKADAEKQATPEYIKKNLKNKTKNRPSLKEIDKELRVKGILVIKT